MLVAVGSSWGVPVAVASGILAHGRYRLTFAGEGAFSVGDTIELDTTGCRFGSVRFTGAMAMSVGSASGYPGLSAAWSARLPTDTSAPVSSTTATLIPSIFALVMISWPDWRRARTTIS